MPLSDTERKSFTVAALVQVDRGVAHIDELLTLDLKDYKQQAGESIVAFDERKAKDATAHRAKMHGRLANMPVDQLRARINLVGFRGPAPVYHADSDYTADELAAIALAYKANQGRTWETEIPALLAADAKMRAGGVTDVIRESILEAR